LSETWKLAEIWKLLRNLESVRVSRPANDALNNLGVCTSTETLYAAIKPGLVILNVMIGLTERDNVISEEASSVVGVCCTGIDDVLNRLLAVHDDWIIARKPWIGS
jgi:hypothetical protein